MTACSDGNLGVIALIPAYQPAESLVEFVRTLLDRGFPQVIVVDDGSDPACAGTFAAITALTGATVLHHAINLGKGAAIKSGLNYACVHWPDSPGVVTIDADGQHGVDDSLKVSARLQAEPDRLVVGARSFDGDVPLRSRFGNSLTRVLFRVLVGVPLSDTQSGLRGIPRALALKLLLVPAQRYEFELDMLLLCKQLGIAIVEEPILTIYLENNKSSHFNPILDSAKIYFSLLRFSMSSVIAAVIDNSIFITLIGLGWAIFPGQVASRSISGITNYLMIRNFVFFSDEQHRKSLPKYIITVVVLGFFSYGMIIFMSEQFDVSVLLAKILAETIIYLANFVIQRDLIFRTSER